MLTCSHAHLTAKFFSKFLVPLLSLSSLSLYEDTRIYRRCDRVTLPLQAITTDLSRARGGHVYVVYYCMLNGLLVCYLLLC